MEQLFYIQDVKIQEYLNMVYPIISTPVNGCYSFLTSPVLDTSTNLMLYVVPFISESTVGFTISAEFTYDGNMYVKTIPDKNGVNGAPWLLYSVPVKESI